MATTVVRAVQALPACGFWADSLSYADAPLDHVRGPRRVTHAHLAGLAARGGRDATLATLDEGLVREPPELTTLVPPVEGIPPQRR